tara:strand:+ start:355 stop:1431 length:1077 start_codon:yes stop_codon:yes gene_type:complete
MINVMAPINPLGYGVAGLNITKALSKLCDVALFPIGDVEVTSQEDADAVKLCLENKNKFDAKAPCVRIWHQFSMAEQIGNGLRCGFPIFELDAFNDVELHHLNSLDKIFVCSEWAKEVVHQNLYSHYKRLDLDSNIHVVPLGVDTSIFKNSKPNDSNSTRFINIGKWEYRKGHDVLVEAFNKAFELEDDVELYMMNHNPFLNKEQEREWVDLYKTSKLGDKITILPRVSTHSQVAEIMSQMDCGVFPSRAEGWNLEAIEMLALGKQLIITDYSAHTEFCTNKNSMLIPIEKKESAYDGIWFHGQGCWAEIGDSQIDVMVEHMRKVHSSNKEPNQAGIETGSSFSWENSASKILSKVSC